MPILDWQEKVKNRISNHRLTQINADLVKDWIPAPAGMTSVKISENRWLKKVRKRECFPLKPNRGMAVWVRAVKCKKERKVGV